MMSVNPDETIAAIASPPGPAERGIIRISGADVLNVVSHLFHDTIEQGAWPQSTRPQRFEGAVVLPGFDVPLPAALMLWPTSRSYTGQPMAEIHTIGSPPLLDAILEQVVACGARHANRGEFTMRAFLAGRIDLVQAEAVIGVIDAADHEELQSALTQLGGGITRTLTAVRGDILSLLGDLEAGLDFVEEDIEFISNQQILDRLQVCHARLKQLAGDSAQRLPSGYHRRIVLAGLPNAGKSTLFNQLLGTQKAIVSPVAGTTRDFLSGIVQIAGMQVEIIDTAGWEAASDLIMQRAQQLRSHQVEASDLVVWCRAADLEESERQQDRALRQSLAECGVKVMDITTRCDLISADQTLEGDVRISVETGWGVEGFLEAMATVLKQDSSARTELVSATAVRCRDCLKMSIRSISAASEAAASQLGDEIIALELRDALHQIASILGEVYTDDILDHIFSNFCIGK